MKIFIACEYSGIVSQAFADRNHEVISCDLLPCEMVIHNHNHIVGDCLQVLNDVKDFDMIIAFPPCTFLANAGLHHLKKDKGRFWDLQNAYEFYCSLYISVCPRVCIENPIGILSSMFKIPSQIINPYNFGSPYAKRTALWLKGLPPLIYGAQNTSRKSITNHVNSRMTQELKSKIKSKFYPEIALAMAEQWG